MARPCGKVAYAHKMAVFAWPSFVEFQKEKLDCTSLNQRSSARLQRVSNLHKRCDPASGSRAYEGLLTCDLQTHLPVSHAIKCVGKVTVASVPAPISKYIIVVRILSCGS